jgi:hypothetical protein
MHQLPRPPQPPLLLLLLLLLSVMLCSSDLALCADPPARVDSQLAAGACRCTSFPQGLEGCCGGVCALCSLECVLHQSIIQVRHQ